MKKLLAVLVSGFVLVACSHNESAPISNEASAPVASAPAEAPVVSSQPVASEPAASAAK